jgi:hypothetical protein
MPTPISIADQGFKLPVSLANIGTTQTVFTDAGGSAITCQVSASPMPAPFNSDTGWQRLYQNIVFDVKAAGLFTGAGTATTFIPTLQFGNSATAGSNSAVAAMTAQTVTSVSGNWMIEAELMWDPTSTKIFGIFWGWIGNIGTIQAQTYVTPTTLTAANFFATGMHFSVTAAFSGANAANTATLTQFDIDPV